MDREPQLSETVETVKRKRGRPAGSRKGDTRATNPRRPTSTQATQLDSVTPAKQWTPPEVREGASAYLDGTLDDTKHLPPVNQLLHSILQQDRLAIARVAKALGVTENTVYRWMNGTSVPQQSHLRRLPDVLPAHRSRLIHVIKQAYPGLLESSPTSVREIQKDIYQRVVELIVSHDEDDLRQWEVVQTLFEYALLQLDPERDGMVITYAKLLPPREDNMVHALREFAMRGHTPWPQAIATRAFLGSNMLAGRVAMLQRNQTWSDTTEGHIPFMVDDNERSSCASPLLRGRSIAGVLIVSSTQPDFFADPRKCETIDEYARLLSIAIPQSDFHSIYSLRLCPMPDLGMQRQRLNEIYIERILRYASAHNLPRQEAETKVERELEKEFEELAAQ
jgi:transcriptional regulator with XRE-family HTH domain